MLSQPGLWRDFGGGGSHLIILGFSPISKLNHAKVFYHLLRSIGYQLQCLTWAVTKSAAMATFKITDSFMHRGNPVCTVRRCSCVPRQCTNRGKLFLYCIFIFFGVFLLDVILFYFWYRYNTTMHDIFVYKKNINYL